MNWVKQNRLFNRSKIIFRWGYVILYLVVILGSLLLNGLFLAVVKKCPSLHRTCHFFFACVAARDLIVTILVIPFVISSQVGKIAPTFLDV